MLTIESNKSNFSNALPDKLKLQAINPQAIIIAGRSTEFEENTQMIKDFEIIKRQYKNICDIYTYDELLIMIDNAINSINKIE